MQKGLGFRGLGLGFRLWFKGLGLAEGFRGWGFRARGRFRVWGFRASSRMLVILVRINAEHATGRYISKTCKTTVSGQQTY